MTVNETMLSFDDIDSLLYVFANQTVLLTQPRVIRRIDAMDSRYYYTLEQTPEGQTATFYISTTSFVKKVTSTPQSLIDWYKKHGEKADLMRDQAADFGTLMHICFAEFFAKGFDFSRTGQLVRDYLNQCGHPASLRGEWTKKLNKAVASFIKFCNEYEIEPILIEGMLASDLMGIAGTLDLVAYATVKRTVKLHNKQHTINERILVNVDFKSGGIHKSAQMQLAINKLIFEENFDHLDIDQNWSWSPKDFRTEPTYTLVNQTKNIYTPALLDHYLAIYEAEYRGELESKIFHLFDGKIMPGDSLDKYHRAVGISDAVLPY